MFPLHVFSRPNMYYLCQYCHFPKTENPPCFLYLSTFQYVTTLMRLKTDYQVIFFYVFLLIILQGYGRVMLYQRGYLIQLLSEGLEVAFS